MAEESNNTQGAPASGETQAPASPQFGLQRLYLKDCSFESPRSPKVFQGQWQPKIKFDIKTRNEKVQDDVFEVVMTLTVEARLQDEMAFLVEIQQAGIFTAKGFKESDLERILATVCPNILFPYARECIDALLVKGSFPAIMLSPINFEALYEQGKAQQTTRDAAPPTSETVQ